MLFHETGTNRQSNSDGKDSNCTNCTTVMQTDTTAENRQATFTVKNEHSDDDFRKKLTCLIRGRLFDL